MLKLLITGNTGLTEHDIKIIESMGYDVDVMPQEKSKPPVMSYDVIICNFLFMNHDISRFSDLKAVQLLSAGLDRMPMDYAVAHDIEVKNATGIYSIPIAEYVVMLTLEAYKDPFYFYENQKKHKWEKKRNLDELSDKTICIVGTGRVGTEVAKRFSVFTEYVIGVDLRPMKKPFFKKVYSLDQLKEALEISNVIVLTLPLTDQTYHMFDDDLLSAMKTDSIFINVARGGLIDDEALRRTIATGKFKSGVLDVFEQEPLDENYWGWDAERIRVIPHNSFVSRRNNERMKKQIISNLRKWSHDLGGGISNPYYWRKTAYWFLPFVS